MAWKENLQQDNEHQIEDMVELDDSSLSLSIIKSIISDPEVKKCYEGKFPDHLHTRILLSLTHEIYEETEARELWHEILLHLKHLKHSLKRDVGISVATLDYLSNINPKLSDPKIIEERKSAFIAQTTIRDELTGLYTREVFDVVLKKEIEVANRNQTPLCLLMIDLDNFKTINDTFGHTIGDQVLKQIGSTLNHTVREMDFVARYGGEELVIIMPQTPLQLAVKVAERIRQTIAQLQFDPFSVTVSIGVSQVDQSTNTSRCLIIQADAALYKAKRNGKNRVEI